MICRRLSLVSGGRFGFAVLGGFFPKLVCSPLVDWCLRGSVVDRCCTGCFDFPFVSFVPSGQDCSGCFCCWGSFVIVAGVVVLCIVWLRFLWRIGESSRIDGPGVKSCSVGDVNRMVSSSYSSLMSFSQGRRFSSVSCLNDRNPSYSLLSFSSYAAFRFEYFSCSGVPRKKASLNS